MRLPNTAHTSRPWRIHELTCDFGLEDVWALPTPGSPDDFPRLVRLMASGDRSQGGSSRAARALWAIRWKVGELLGWDDPDAGLSFRVPTLRDRRLSRPDGRLRKAERSAWDRVHGRDQAVPVRDGLPGADATDRASVAGAHRPTDTGASDRRMKCGLSRVQSEKV
jgi:hypothetical protein